MIRFKVRAHSTRNGEQMVEVLRDGQFVGALYPEADGVRFVSAYDGLVQASTETGSALASRPVEMVNATLRCIDIKISEKRLND